MLKNIRYFFEFLVLGLFFLLCKALPVTWASNMGGFIGRHIGPYLGKTKTAERHIAQSIPELSDQQTKQTAIMMWDNLGRLLAEYPHLKKLSDPQKGYSELVNPNNISAGTKESKPIFFISAHMANWELLQPIAKSFLNLDFNGIIRNPNNPLIAWLLKKVRQTHDDMGKIAKSSKGARDIVKFMKDKQNIGLLVDQKYNEGIAIPFFGKDAMTSTGFISLCQKYDYQIVPSHLERTEASKFKLSFENPIDLYTTQGTPRNELDVMTEIHGRLEAWIRQNPSQWIWLHRRWPKD